MIKGVVVRYKNGMTFKLPAPCRHKDCHKLAENLGLGKKDRNFFSNGFYTEDKEFMSREEAREYVKKEGKMSFSHPKYLFSEDLW